jgi:nucleotide-binding universal stress UspA family protein
MFTRIVVPLDGSQVAAHALGYATALAERFHASLTLVTAIPPRRDEIYSGDVLSVTDSTARTAYDATSARATQDATDRLESVAAPLRARGIACEVALHHGNPAAEIIACAGDTPGTLIAMGTHGRTGMERWRLGSVAQHVMRHAAVPTLIVRARDEAVPDAHLAVAEITVTLDGSAFAEQALPAASALADAFGVPLVLLTVLPDIVIPASQEDTEIVDAALAAARVEEEGAQAYLAHVAERVTTPTRTVRSVSLRGAGRGTVGAISDYLEPGPAGIVVLASHGRGGVLRWVMGSTAEGMMARSPQPVLIVRAGK